MPTDLDLASLLASRLCHDVVGPVGAIQNAFELMAQDESVTEMAMDLIRKSARQASAKLMYARMAYGVVGGAEMLDPAEAGRLTADIFADERATLDWTWAGPAAPKDPVKLAMLLATYALGCVPRGGTITVRHNDAGLEVRAESESLRTPQFMDVVTGADTSDPRAAQALCIHRLAAGIGSKVAVDSDGSRMLFIVAHD